MNESVLKNLLVNTVYNTNKDHIISDCPFCGKEKHFYVNIKNKFGCFDCKKCGQSGGIKKLLLKLNKINLLEESIVNDNFNIIKKRELNPSINEIKIIKPPVKTLPPGFKRLYYHEYLEKRGFNLYDKFVVGTTDLIHRLKNYIIFPIYEEEKVRGYVARCFLSNEEIKKQNLLRYSNSKQTEFSNLLYGIDDINFETKCVIIVEGVFDKFSIDSKLDLFENNNIKCVCTFGKKISKNQIYKLVSKNIKKIVLLYDYDAIDAMKKISFDLQNYFEVLVGCTISKDPGDCDKIELLNVFNDLHSPSDFFLNKIMNKVK